MRKKLFGGLLAAVLLVPSQAAKTEETLFHLMMIREVFGGTTAAPNAQYIILQMYAAGQQFVSGHRVLIFDSTGTQITSFLFSSDVANGNNQAVILIATPEAAAFFGVTPDLSMTAVIPPRGGKICFDATNIDCISWGNYTGSSIGTGTPFNQCGGLELGKAVRRRTNICGLGTLLEFCDDTNNSATDFTFVTPAVRNNANQTGTIPPSTCGNGTIESLEQCDDGNTNNGDGCSSTCQIEPPFCANAKGDLNGSGGLTASDVVLMLTCVFTDPTGCGLCYTDVNCDCKLTASDVVLELLAVFNGAPFPC